MQMSMTGEQKRGPSLAPASMSFSPRVSIAKGKPEPQEAVPDPEMGREEVNYIIYMGGKGIGRQAELGQPQVFTGSARGVRC